MTAIKRWSSAAWGSSMTSSSTVRGLLTIQIKLNIARVRVEHAREAPRGRAKRDLRRYSLTIALLPTEDLGEER